MANLRIRAWRVAGLGTVALGALLATPLAVAAAEPTVTPTFTKDIAPIFQAKCESCHRTDSIAPMSLAVAYRQDDWHPEVQE